MQQRAIKEANKGKSKGQGRVTKKSGSNKLYVDFFYFNRRIEKSTWLNDTEENRMEVRHWLQRQMQKIDLGTFRFSEAFPNASEKEKAFFAELEGWEYKPEADTVLFGDFLDEWVKNVLPKLPHTTRVDYLSSINPWIRPFFSRLTFFQINSQKTNKFVSELRHKPTEQEQFEGKPGRPFSNKRVKNILSHLRVIWETACTDNRWNLPSPFPPPQKRGSISTSNEILAKDIETLEITTRDLCPGNRRDLKHDRLPLRFNDWMLVYDQLDEWYRPIAKLSLLTGMIPSELAGLCPGHIANGFIHVRQIVSRGRLYPYPKTDSRIRDIRITKAIQEELDLIGNRNTARKSPFIITTTTGHPFNHNSFGKEWATAVEATGITYRVPYALRHSFAAWSLCIGIDKNRLVYLMGHANKEMVYDVYGKYVEGLELDREPILAYFGEDFLYPGTVRTGL